MIQIEIEGTKRRFEDANQRWIREEITRRLRDHPRVCVRVMIEQKPEIDFILPSVDCPVSGGSRQLSRRENEIWELWKKLGLADAGLPKGKLAGNLWAFLQQVRRLL